MFFTGQLFENFDLSGYRKTDISIPRTNVHIYEFECEETDTCYDNMSMAKKLDELTQRLTDEYSDLFQVVNSESSQFFCGQLYPLIVDFETKLRYALYISQALFGNGNVNKESFLLTIGKKGKEKKKEIEEADFGEIYAAVFTDPDFQDKVRDTNGKRQFTKADLLKKIQEIDESSLWQKIMGTGYNYIENHFLEIENYRNDVMHNHLISYDDYEKAQKVMEQAVSELDRVISDKLIVNNSEYLNDVNIFEVLSGIYQAVKTFTTFVNNVANSERMSNIAKAMQLLAMSTSDIKALPSNDESEIKDGITTES